MSNSESLIRKEGHDYLQSSPYPPLTLNINPSMERTGSGWKASFGVLQKHWQISFAFLFVVVIGVTTLTFLMTSTYKPKALLEIDSPGEEIFSFQNGQASELGAQRYMDTQLEILRSDDLAIATIQALHLDQNSEFVGRGRLRRLLGSSTRPSPASALETALKSFQSDLSVSQVRDSHLVEISMTSRDPVLAANIINTFVDLFIKRDDLIRSEATTQASTWVSRQLEQLRGKIAASNRALVDFQNKNGIVNVNDAQNQTVNTVTQKVSALNQQLTQAEADRIETEAYVKMADSGNTGSLPQVQNSPLIQNLTERLGDSRAQLAQAMAIYGNRNPNVLKLQSQVDEIEAQLTTERQRVAQQLQTSFQSAQAREQLLTQAMDKMRGQVNSMNEKVVQYNFLKSEAQANTDLYNTLSAHLKEAGVTAGIGTAGIIVIDQARVLKNPTSPQRFQIITAGLFLGLLGGLVLPFLKEHLDDTISTPEDVKSCTGLSTVGQIPYLGIIGANGNGTWLSLPRRVFQLSDGNGKNQRKPRPRLFLDDPRSPESEAVRNLLAAIQLHQPKKPPRVILVASSAPREGKTTIAINLATAMAQHGKTCLVDADVRNPAVTRTLGISGGLGLSDILRGSTEIDDTLLDFAGIPNLTILPGGSAMTSPGDLLSWESMHDILLHLRNGFEHVVVDSPPIIPFADARALSTLVDGVIIVGRCGSTTRQEIASSAEILEGIQAPVLGVVLNAAESNTRYYDYYAPRT